MLTPQQIQEISFEKAIFGGYDMDSVDDVLEPLTEDYITLYKENSVLKSKMRILVEKLEEYRKQEASMQSAILAAQKTCEQMTADTEKQCAKMLREAEEAAKAKTDNLDALVGGEKERLEAAQKASRSFIDGMERRLKRQIELLQELREKELPEPASAPSEPVRRAFDFDKEPSAPTTQEKADALIEEIGQHIEESLEAVQPAQPPQEPADSEAAPADEPESSRLHGELSPEKLKIFEELQFGRNYDPKK